MDNNAHSFDPCIRPIRLRTDLSSVANLIELCFLNNMDSDGRDYIRHIRQIAGSVGNYLLEGTTPENSQLPFHGYVWVENEKIIGNLTLILIRKGGMGAYFIANVAVHPDHRGRGIARQLTDRALAHVREHGGRKVYLQVRDDNPVAIRIYKTHGFDEIARRTTWVFKNPPAQTADRLDGIQITRRFAEHWGQQKIWLEELYPPEITWNLSLKINHFQPGFSNWLSRFINGSQAHQWSARKNGQLIGIAAWESGFTGSDYIWMATSPAWEHEAIKSLLSTALRSMIRPSRVTLNYPAGRAAVAFRETGMEELHTLIWMSLNIPCENLISRLG